MKAQVAPCPTRRCCLVELKSQTATILMLYICQIPLHSFYTKNLTHLVKQTAVCQKLCELVCWRDGEFVCKCDSHNESYLFDPHKPLNYSS